MIGLLPCTILWSYTTFINDMAVTLAIVTKFLLTLGSKVVIFFKLVALDFAHIVALRAPCGICNIDWSSQAQVFFFAS